MSIALAREIGLNIRDRKTLLKYILLMAFSLYELIMYAPNRVVVAVHNHLGVLYLHATVQQIVNFQDIARMIRV